jgi:sugar lactone lactonase YvrE
MCRLPKLIGALVILAFASHTAAAEEVWSTSGFNAPESVVLDAARNVFYVSNVAGQPNEKNGAGFISRMTRDGTIEELEWVAGFDAPKGMVLDGTTLYVTDIDRLLAIEVEAGEVSGSWEAEGAQFLNDPAVDGEGRVFVSDMAANRIYVLESDSLSVWLEEEELQHPNGLAIDDGRLIVAAWGRDMQPDFSTRVAGHLLAINLETREIEPLGSGEPVGNLDGLEPDGTGAWLVTDWIAGGLYRIQPDGSFEQLLDLNQGSADLEFVEEERLAVIPMMMDGRVIAHRID